MQTLAVCFLALKKSAAVGDPLLMTRTEGQASGHSPGPLGEVRKWRNFCYISACRTWINRQVCFFFNCYSFYNSIKLNYEEAERQTEATLTRYCAPCSNSCGALALAMQCRTNQITGTIQNSFKNIIEEHHNKNTMIKTSLGF